MAIRKLSENLKIIRRNLKNAQNSNYARDFKSLTRRYQIPHAQDELYTSANNAILFRSYVGAELFVKILYAISPVAADIYVVTQDLSATVAICRSLHHHFPDVEGIPGLVELETYLPDMVEYLHRFPSTPEYPKHWMRKCLKNLQVERHYIINGSNFEDRFNQLREQWFNDYQKACDTLIDRLRTETSPQYLSELLKILNNEFSAQLKVMLELEKSFEEFSEKVEGTEDD